MTIHPLLPGTQFDSGSVPGIPGVQISKPGKCRHDMFYVEDFAMI